MHRRWKRQTVDLALAGSRGRPPASSTSAAAAATSASSPRTAAPAAVVGADFTLPMLAVARRARRRRAGRRSRFVQADALRLPFADGTFDVVTIGYGLRNIADIPAALSARCAACSRPAAAPSSSTSASPTTPSPRALYRASSAR